MDTRFPSFPRRNWVLAGEHFALRVGSFAFSMVSAHAILWFFNSLAMVQDSDPLQRYVPYVIAGGFGLLGYFVSRGLVYRMMRKERIRVYIAICLLFEFVEVVCNFAQAVSSVPHVDWLSRMRGGPHDGLSFVLYVAYSIVPVVTFVLAVVDMDLEKEKLSAASVRASLAPRSAVTTLRATTVPNVPARSAPVVVPQRTQGNGNGLPKAAVPVLTNTPGNGTMHPRPDATTSNGFRFPFAKRGGDDSAMAVQMVE